MQEASPFPGPGTRAPEGPPPMPQETPQTPPTPEVAPPASPEALGELSEGQQGMLKGETDRLNGVMQKLGDNRFARGLLIGIGALSMLAARGEFSPVEAASTRPGYSREAARAGETAQRLSEQISELREATRAEAAERAQRYEHMEEMEKQAGSILFDFLPDRVITLVKVPEDFQNTLDSLRKLVQDLEASYAGLGIKAEDFKRRFQYIGLEAAIQRAESILGYIEANQEQWQRMETLSRLIEQAEQGERKGDYSLSDIRKQAQGELYNLQDKFRNAIK